MRQTAPARVDALGLTPPGGVLGTHGQQFGDSSPTGGGASTEIGVPLKYVGRALQVILSAAQQAQNPSGRWRALERRT